MLFRVNSESNSSQPSISTQTVFIWPRTWKDTAEKRPMQRYWLMLQNTASRQERSMKICMAISVRLILGFALWPTEEHGTEKVGGKNLRLHQEKTHIWVWICRWGSNLWWVQEIRGKELAWGLSCSAARRNLLRTSSAMTQLTAHREMQHQKIDVLINLINLTA